jgi:hypothetical protein
MDTKHHKPNWWLLFLLIPLMLALLVVVPQFFRASLSGEIADGTVVVAIFGLMLLWVRANESALVWEEAQKARGTIKITIIEPAAPESHGEISFDNMEEIEVLAASPNWFANPTPYPGGLTQPRTNPRNN